MVQMSFVLLHALALVGNAVSETESDQAEIVLDAPNSTIFFGPKGGVSTVALSGGGEGELRVDATLEAAEVRVNGQSVEAMIAAAEARVLAQLPTPAPAVPTNLLNIDGLTNYCASGTYGGCNINDWGHLPEHLRDTCLGVGFHGRGSWWRDTHYEACKMPHVGNTVFLNAGETVGIGLDGPAVGAKVTEVAFALAKVENDGDGTLMDGASVTAKILSGDGMERYVFSSVSYTGEDADSLRQYGATSNRDLNRKVGDQLTACAGDVNTGGHSCSNCVSYACEQDEWKNGFRWVKFWGEEAPLIMSGDQLVVELVGGSGAKLAVAKGRWENPTRMPGYTKAKFSSSRSLNSDGTQETLGDLYGVFQNAPFRCCSVRRQPPSYFAGSHGACAECKDLPLIKVVGIPSA